VLTIKEWDFGELIQHNLTENHTDVRSKRCDNKFNKLRIWITDENDKPIYFNGADIQNEISLFIN
jgi:hypothetical protein